jgi:CubicO group peptidase (beta-lactamase class C family)
VRSRWRLEIGVALGLAMCGCVREEADSAKKIDAMFAAALPDDAPGAAVLVVQRGRVLLCKGYGLADVAAGKRIGPETRFYLASLTKPFTALAIQMLVEQGKLGYETAASRFFPELAEQGGGITVRHLLTHTSGLADYIEAFEPRDGKSDLYPAEVVKLIGPRPLRFRPGARFEYSDSGYVVLAGIVDGLAGEPYPAFLEHHVFEPLRMQRTFCIPGRPIDLGDVAVPYVAAGQGFQPSGFGADPRDLVYGDGGVVSTVEDLYVWESALWAGKLVGEASLREAFTPGVTEDGRPTGYGLGWRIEGAGPRAIVRHSGSWRGFEAAVARVPDADLTAVVLSNRGGFNATGFVNHILSIVLGS